MLKQSFHLAVLVAALLLLPAGFGCSGADEASDQDKYAAGKYLEVTGTISVRGAAPAAFVLLLADDQDEYTLQPSALTGELRRLDNVRVAVEGNLQVPAGNGPILLEVSRYRILALENGDQPVVGWLVVRQEGLFLQGEEGPDWHLTGNLASLLEGFNGAKVWVVGEQIRRGGAERDLEVEGYGILAER
jgi:hypothetical protein